MIKRISKQQLVVIALAAGGLLLGLLGYVALVAPQKSHAAKLDTEIETAQSQLDAAMRAPKIKGASVGAADLFRLTKAIPGYDDVPGILIQLSRVAQASKVKIVGLRPAPDVPLTQGYAVLPIELSVTGKYANLSGFLHRLRGLVTVRHGRLEAMGRLFTVDNLSLTAGDKSVAATVTMNAFVYGGAAPLSATAGPPPSGAAAATTTSASGSGK